MGLRVVQWATGGVGVAAIKGVLIHPELELAGRRCIGRQGGQGRRRTHRHQPLGITATNSLDEILALDADAVIYSPLLAETGHIAALLRSGKNVVTPSRVVLSPRQKRCDTWRGGEGRQCDAPWHRIAPGGITEKFARCFRLLSTGVRFRSREEFSDLRTYQAPDCCAT